MVEATLDGGPLRTTPPVGGQGQEELGRGRRSQPRRTPRAQRVLRRLAVLIGIPVCYLAVAALGRGLSQQSAPAAPATTLDAAGPDYGPLGAAPGKRKVESTRTEFRVDSIL